ncbi:MAG: hypothetical protein V7744_09960 [Pseudomonadales bacterium]
MQTTIPDKETLLKWARGYTHYWNAADRDGWIENYRTVFQGDSVRMLDPVGTPEKFGFKNCCTDSFDLFNDHVKFEIREESLFILGNTVAWVMNNIISSSGKEGVAKSIETFQFEPDGSLIIKTWYDVSGATSGRIKESMSEYLPDSFK